MNDILLSSLSRDDLRTMLTEIVAESVENLNRAQAPEEYLTRQETADLLKVTLPTIDSWRKDGTLHPYKINSRILFKRSETEKALESINF